MRPLLLLALACALLSGCGPTTVNSLVKEHGAERLAAADLLTLVKGNTLQLHAYNEEMQLYFDPSGRLYGRDQFADRDAGRWDVIEGGELCLRMDSWWYGDLRCLEAYRKPSGGRLYLAGGNGVIRFSGVQSSGDSQSLAGAAKRKEGRQSLRTTKDKAAAAPPLVEERPQPVADARDTGVTVEFLARDCPGCNLAGADLGKAELAGAKLAGADLHGANLSMANLRRADLQKANLNDATLVYANLPGANLRGADLRGARLKGANLIKADLTGARLEGAELSETLRDGARGLPPASTP